MKVFDDIRKNLRRPRPAPKKTIPLLREYEFFEANRPGWALEGHLGEYVLIKGAYVAFFSNLKDAYEAGIDKFGDVDFFLREVTKEQVVQTVPFWLEEHLERADP